MKDGVNNYDSSAGIYDEIMGDAFSRLTFLQYKGNFFAGMRMLDLACGSGYFLANVVERFPSAVVYGVDISSKMIQRAREKLAGHKQSSLRVGDISNVEYPKHIDLATINFDAINHIGSLSEWRKIFQGVYDSLIEGGLFLWDMNTQDRIIYDFAKTEEFYDGRVRYKGVGLELEKSDDYVKRKLRMEMSVGSRQAITTIEEIAPTFEWVEQELLEIGFKEIRSRCLYVNDKVSHPFLKNRLFISASK